MLLLVLLSVALAVANGAFNEQEIIARVNAMNTTWRAGTNRRWTRQTYDNMRQSLGVHLGRHAALLRSAPRNRMVMDSSDPIPTTFDARQQWPYCKSLQEVRDQSSCGSCWAFGAVEAMTDRICIATKGKQQLHLSATDLLSCCTSCGMGCNGGEPLSAWQYWVSDGIVTGGNNTSPTGCRPYPFPPCEHHSNRTHFKPCGKDLFPTPECTRQCQSSYPHDFAGDKHFGKTAYQVDNNVQAIQREIMTNGPAEAAFQVYADFLTYREGVYQHVTGEFDGGHAVKLIGWGSENGVDYWLLANSWNFDWGLDGFFKILRGNNECGIEDQIVAGLPKIKKNKKAKKY